MSKQKLDKPARVGAVVFSKGIEWRLVIECAQRAYENHEAHKAVLTNLETSPLGESDCSRKTCEGDAMKILPSEPTREMKDAALAELSDVTVQEPKAAAWDAVRAYRAMASAYVFDEAAAVERVARDIYEALELDVPWDDAGDGWRSACRRAARAAIRALMEGE